MACTFYNTFFRICGHIWYCYEHTNICVDATLAEPQKYAADAVKCWNTTLPFREIPQYVIAKCPYCRPAWQEDMDSVRMGHNAHMIYGPVTPLLALQRAMTYRIRVEEHERMLHGSRLIRIAQAKAKRDNRDVKRATWWEEYDTHFRNGPDLAQRPKILDPTDTFLPADYRLLQPAEGHFEEEDDCPICRFPLNGPPFEEPGETEGNAKALPCGHIFHFVCVVQNWLTFSMTSGRCPMCRQRYNWIFCPGFEESKTRWYEAERKLYQVEGYLEFSVGCGRVPANYGFKPFQSVDRWGDELPPPDIVPQNHQGPIRIP